MIFYRGRNGKSIQRRVTITLLITASTLTALAGPALCYEGVLRDPVTLGAWLFRDNCTRCHRDYGKAQLAQQYDGRSALIKAIGNNGCNINWSRQHGGPWGKPELEALADYMLKWEELQSEPALPELPPARLEASSQTKAQPQQEQSTRPEYDLDAVQLPAALQQLVSQNPIAHGGLLYTHNCHRCHLAYEKARMGRGLSSTVIERFVTEGKTSTQMRPFAQVLGGQLSTKEIRAIVAYIVRWEEAGEELALPKLLLTPPSLDPSDLKPVRLPRFPKVKGDANIGKQLFSKHCSSCHGGSAEGYIGVSLQQSSWVVRTDLFLKSVIKKGVPGSIMADQNQDSDYNLTPGDIDNVVSFLLSLHE
jgi:mono/diheme cytochrome c family protein